MIYIIVSVSIILLIILLKFLINNTHQDKDCNSLNLKKINKEIIFIYKRKASVSEMKNILLVIQKYKEQYKMYPHKNDLKRIIIKYKEN